MLEERSKLPQDGVFLFLNLCTYHRSPIWNFLNFGVICLKLLAELFKTETVIEILEIAFCLPGPSSFSLSSTHPGRIPILQSCFEVLKPLESWDWVKRKRTGWCDVDFDSKILTQTIYHWWRKYFFQRRRIQRNLFSTVEIPLKFPYAWW